MFHNCSYCNHQTKYKANHKTHVKNIHGENISQEKHMKNSMKNGNPMKNEHCKELKKIEILMKKNFKIGLEINTMKRELKSVDESNANEFSKLAREYVKLTDAGLPKDLFTSGSTLPYIENMYSQYQMETQNLIGDTNGTRKKIQGGTYDEEVDEVRAGVDSFLDKIVKDDKQLMHV